MNKAVVLIAASCVVAFIAMQVDAAYWGGGYQQAAIYGGNSGYSAYLNQLERYNEAQQLKSLTKATRGLRNSALVSLGKFFLYIFFFLINFL